MGYTIAGDGGGAATVLGDTKGTKVTKVTKDTKAALGVIGPE